MVQPAWETIDETIKVNYRTLTRSSDPRTENSDLLSKTKVRVM